MKTNSAHQHDPLRPHSHEPNPEAPGADPTLSLEILGAPAIPIGVDDLQALPQVALPECYIVSTGHGTSGPFTFGGPTLLHLIAEHVGEDVGWAQVEVVSADGFGTRILRHELTQPTEHRPIILAWQLDGIALNRQQGLVRLIVPSERDDALRQVKWVEIVRVVT